MHPRHRSERVYGCGGRVCAATNETPGTRRVLRSAGNGPLVTLTRHKARKMAVELFHWRGRRWTKVLAHEDTRRILEKGATGFHGADPAEGDDPAAGSSTDGINRYHRGSCSRFDVPFLRGCARTHIAGCSADSRPVGRHMYSVLFLCLRGSGAFIVGAGRLGAVRISRETSGLERRCVEALGICGCQVRLCRSL